MSKVRFLSSLINVARFSKYLTCSTSKHRLLINQNNARSFSFTTMKLDSPGDKIGEPKSRVLTDGEQNLVNMLKNKFKNAKTIEVTDISGGCGSMYAIFVESIEFEGLRTVKQHQMINDCLKDEIINKMHGIRIYTSIPEK